MYFNFSGTKAKMRLPGIEPGSAGWQPTIIPLNQRRSIFFNIIIFQ